jgi:hypothetical protein
MTAKREKAFVDSINEEICTLLIGRKAFSAELPAQLLPKGTSEGDWIIMRLQRSERLKRTHRRSMGRLIEKLEKNELSS